jgi:tRNA (cytidine/uridine-2'-O-)-methyltransferase
MRYIEFEYSANDTLVFGRESAGVPEEVSDACEVRVKIPMTGATRSLNVAIAAGMILGEALRQTDTFPLAQGTKRDHE